jgi:multicomponent Na+:H+ antiporter subunit D
VTTLDALYVAPPALATHAPILLVTGPLMAACATALAPSSRTSWMLSVAGSVFAIWMALALAGEVARRGAVDYVIGGFAPPMGIAFHVDALGALMALLISSVGVLTALYSGHALQAEVRPEKHSLVQAGLLLCQAGLLGLVCTGDAFNAFVFLEVSSIGTYALVAIGEKRDRRALPAAFNYLIMGTIGATFYVIGVGFLYAATGTLNMADMATRLVTLTGTSPVQAGFAFIVVGLGIKAAMFPLHGWLPGAYSFAPSLVSVLLSATATKAAIYLITRFALDVFPPDAAFGEFFLHWVLAPLAATAAIACSIQAIFEREVRRMLAFSSVAQAGFILLGISMATAAGVSAGLFYLMAHALLKSGMFMALGGLAMSLRARSLADFAGVARDAPWSAAAFGVGAASLVGAPLTMGFLAKWRLIEAGLMAGQIWIVAVIAIASLLTLAYVGRMFEALFFRPPPPGAQRAHEAPAGVLVPVWILAGLSIWFGLDASLPEGLADAASAALSGAAP